ncbi:MAG: fused MFS/spermidine synthase [Verrucomicrobiota bacterium]
MPSFAIAIFLGAFLLFQLQPLIGKFILPWFGGAPEVWTTCMLFFQVLLLAGYAYAHASAQWLKPRVQVLVQVILVVGALALLPITPTDSWKPGGAGNPTGQILLLLLGSIGLPYFVLSATSPLMQHWFSRVCPGKSPFRLFALSNAASLIALLSFPFFVESHFTRSLQARVWGWGLAVYAAGILWCGTRVWRTIPEAPPSAGAGRDRPPGGAQRILWLALPMCASVLLLATTNKICQEVAVIPFLWVLPLSLYLLTFIISFDSPRWYQRLPWGVLLAASAAACCWALFKGPNASIELQILIYSAGLFVSCMICHGELYRLKPEPGRLTGYYLAIAGGGALGGIFVALIGPLIFNDYYELQIGLTLCVGLLALVQLREWMLAGMARWIGLSRRERWQRSLAFAGLLVGMLALANIFWYEATHFSQDRVLRTRSFYGTLTIYRKDDDDPGMRGLSLAHGRTLHGLQFTDPERAQWPTTYYGTQSGIGLAMNALPAEPRRIGLVGLGVGTLATYARPGDFVHVYEINPDVVKLAGSYFTYLSNCQGRVEITPGDARLSLEREAPQQFDLLVLDAFNSDAIPVHLLSREAFSMYERHVRTNGIIAVHVSNKSLNLEPVVMNLARELGYRAAVIEVMAPADQPWLMSPVWVLLTRDSETLRRPDIRIAARPARMNVGSIPVWTDDFASLFQILHKDVGPQMDAAFTGPRCEQAYARYDAGDYAGAIAVFRSSLKQRPRSPVLLSDFAFLLATCPEASLRNLPEAVTLAEKACEVTHYQDVADLGTLAAVYSESGRFAEAAGMAEKAVAFAEASGDEVMAEKNREMIELYRAGKPFHESRLRP